MTEREATVRFYVDADMLGLGKLLGQLRNDITYAGDPGAFIHKRRRPPCPITRQETDDVDWIPEVTRRGWLIVTRDISIAQNPNEQAAVRENGARMVALNQRDAQNKWGQLEVFMTQWRAPSSGSPSTSTLAHGNRPPGSMQEQGRQRFRTLRQDGGLEHADRLAVGQWST